MRAVAGVITLALIAACRPSVGMNATRKSRIEGGRAERALDEITIPNASDVRGNVTLPTTLAAGLGATVDWTSSNRNIVSDRAIGAIAAGVVTRPPVGAQPANVTLTACLTIDVDKAC